MADFARASNDERLTENASVHIRHVRVLAFDPRDVTWNKHRAQAYRFLPELRPAYRGGSCLKVLVVDDHPLMQQVLFGVLNQLGPKLQVLQPANWDDALGLANTRDELELVLMVRRRPPVPRCDSPVHPYPDMVLTERQRQVLALLVQGKPNKIISRELGLAEGTVKIHINGIFKALKVSNRTQAVIAASQLGLRLGEAAAKIDVRANGP